MNRIIEDNLVVLEKYAPSYNLNCSSLGIITAGDSNVFAGIQILHASIKNKINFVCYDIGFTQKQREWARSNNLIIKSIDIPETHRKIHRWQTYLKPWFLDDSPFEYTLWIDSDCITVGNLSLMEQIKERKTFFSQHWIKQNLLRKNSDELYKKFPAKLSSMPYVNAGAFGINKLTHSLLIKDWKMMLNEGIVNDRQILKYVVQDDEGALNWAIQKHCVQDDIKNDHRYNCFSAFEHSHKNEFMITYQQKVLILKGCNFLPQIFFRKILQDQESYILHFSTCMNHKGKYWTQWL
jgi:hypothetical protein